MKLLAPLVKHNTNTLKKNKAGFMLYLMGFKVVNKGRIDT